MKHLVQWHLPTLMYMERDWFMQWAAVRMMYSLRMVPPQNPMWSLFRSRACRDRAVRWTGVQVSSSGQPGV